MKTFKEYLNEGVSDLTTSKISSLLKKYTKYSRNGALISIIVKNNTIIVNGPREEGSMSTANSCAYKYDKNKNIWNINKTFPIKGDFKSWPSKIPDADFVNNLSTWIEKIENKE